MRITLGINDRMLTIDMQVSKVANEPAEAPAIFDVSKATTQVRPQWDHEGPVPVARLGFQPNGGTA